MWDKSTFDLHLGERFRIIVKADLALDVELIESTPVGPPKQRGELMFEPFSVIFRASERVAAPQKIYRVEHESLGAMDIFLVPLGPDAKGMRYEAIFN
jgi:hypothetical protein